MAIDFIIPKLGDDVSEATIVSWLVDDGTEVNEGDEILEVETDKAVVPIPANAAGFLKMGPYQAGDLVSILAVVATIGAKDEPFSPGSSGAQADETNQKSFNSGETVLEAEPAAASPATSTEVEALAEIGQPGDAVSTLRATPVAQRLAADLGIDLQSINGSGERGKITKQDVLEATDQQKSAELANAPEAETTAPAAEATGPKPVAVAPTPTKSVPAASPAPAGDVLERIPLKGIRGVISRRMAESVHTTARVTLVTEADATELVTLREQLKARFTEVWGFAPGYNDLLALIVANALRQFPYMNARLSTDGDAIEQLAAINLGMAVDTDRGLMVPVIRDVDRLGLQEFGAVFREMVERARSGKSTLEDLSGNTFTITSLGIYRVDAFTPVINLPDLAILGIGRIKPKPVVKDDEVIVRKMVTLSLVFDHRLTDGAPAARFLDYICELIEEPYLLFLTKR
jgi:pyruvate dehydrogenase E2 component (dihydrolipoamide acetyltransferase)